MKATKYTLLIKAEALSRATFVSLVMEACNRLDSEHIVGSICMDDGDTVEWGIKTESVEF